MNKGYKLNRFMYSVTCYALERDKATGYYYLMIKPDKANVNTAIELAKIYDYHIYRNARGVKVVTDMQRI